MSRVLMNAGPLQPAPAASAWTVLTQARKAMVQYYCDFTTEHAPDLKTLTRELPNIVIAIAFCQETGNWQALAVLAHNADHALLNAGHGHFLVRAIEVALSSPEWTEEPGLQEALRVLLVDYAMLLEKLGERQRALTIVQKLLAESPDDPAMQILAHFALATAYMGMEDMAKAREHWNTCRELARENGVNSYETLANYFLDISGDQTDVLAELEMDEPSKREEPRLWRRYMQYHLQANKLYQQEQHEAARTKYLEVLDLATTLNEREGKALALYHLGELSRIAGDSVQAKQYFKQGEEIALSLNNHTALAAVYSGLGRLYLFQEEYELARPYLQECSTLEEEWGETAALARSLYWQGYALANTGEPAAARTVFQRARTIFQQVAPELVAAVDDVLERLAAATGDRS